MQDDMELAPDFFTYFEALAPLLDKDDMLMCVSSWNDHGQVRLSYTAFLWTMPIVTAFSVIVLSAFAVSEVEEGAQLMPTCLLTDAPSHAYHIVHVGTVREGHAEAVPHRLLPRLGVDAEAGALGRVSVSQTNPRCPLRFL